MLAIVLDLDKTKFLKFNYLYQYFGIVLFQLQQKFYTTKIVLYDEITETLIKNNMKK